MNFSGKLTLTLGLDFSVPHQAFGQNFWDCPRRDARAFLGVSTSIGHRLFAGMKVDAQADRSPVEKEKFIGVHLEIDLIEVSRKISKNPSSFTQTGTRSSLWRRPGNKGLPCCKDLRKLIPKSWSKTGPTGTDFWAKSDITIDGDDDTQQGIRFCIFQMQQTYRGVIDGANIGAKGLTGEAYNGNAFWDTETYCLPFYLFSNPPAAKSLLDFRYKTLPQALARAKDLDCVGACYPIATSTGRKAARSGSTPACSSSRRRRWRMPSGIT